jgi:hypothetical protein
MGRNWFRMRHEAAKGHRDSRGIWRRCRILLLPVLLASSGSAPAATQDGTGAGLIYGSLFTAQHADSIAPGTAIALVYRSEDGTKHRVDTMTDANGGFSFPGLATGGDIAYVMRVRGVDRDYLSSPVRFVAGQDRILFNFVMPGRLPAHARAGELGTGRSVGPLASRGQGPPRSRATGEWLFFGLLLAAGAVLLTARAVRLRMKRSGTKVPFERERVSAESDRITG